MKPSSPFEEKIRAFSLPIILAVAALCVVLVIVVPQFNQLKTDDQLLSDRQKASSVLQTKLSSLESLDESSQTETLETALSALPLEEPLRQSLLNLGSLLDRHQIAASQIKIEFAADNLLINFIGLGSMSSLQNFITDAGKILPISAIASIQSSKIDDSTIASNSASNYGSEILIRIFFKPPPQTIGRSSDPLPQLTADHLKTQGLLSEFEQIQPAPTDDSNLNPPGSSRLFPE